MQNIISEFLLFCRRNILFEREMIILYDMFKVYVVEKYII